MMNRFRTHGLALLGAMLVLALSVSGAFAHHPQHPDNRGNAVSTFVHELVFGADQEGDEEGEEDAEEEQDEEDLDEEMASTHGQCVREVARDLDAVGGPNENHGGAVSEAARVTCRTDGADEQAEDEQPEDEEGTDESTDRAGSKDRGRSAEAHDRAPGKNKDQLRGAGSAHGNGHGHGRR
jgi:hypothetical protein